MPALSPYNQSRVRYHLNFVQGAVNAVLEGWLVQACETIYDDYHESKIQRQLDLCENAEKELESEGIEGELKGQGLLTKELITGDTNRSIIRIKGQPYEERIRNYVIETDRLAKMMGLPNLQREDIASYWAWERSGEYIKAVPGPADTAVSSRMIQLRQTGGGFGIPYYAG